jgi:hypothetical protein
VKQRQQQQLQHQSTEDWSRRLHRFQMCFTGAMHTHIMVGVDVVEGMIRFPFFDHL